MNEIILRDNVKTRVCGIGINDVANASTHHRKVYDVWKNMIDRCYNKKAINYKNYGGNGVTVDQYWHLFSNFAEWYYINSVNDYALDKDLLIKGNKEYSEYTCCFLPTAINSALANKQTNNSSGAIGVIWNKQAKKWQSFMKVHGKQVHLGYYNTIEEGAKAYREARDKHLIELANEYKETLTNEAYEALCEGGL